MLYTTFDINSIFPKDHSALRLIGALLAAMNEQWQSKRYLDMDEFHEWCEGQKKESSNVLEINIMV